MRGGLLGKFGNKYSALYDPQLLLQTTVTGQLSLLMLIERIEVRTACKVKSANTDGITVWAPNSEEYDLMLEVAAKWEKETDFVLEAIEYESVHSQDVNNYLALTSDGYFKGKGIFADGGLMKNPKFRIITTAIQELIQHGIPLEDTIKGCTNPAEFMALQKVTGGAEWKGKFVGKTVRWYMATDGDHVTRATNGYKIGLTEFAHVANRMPSKVPGNLNYDWYIEYATNIAKNVGVAL